DRAAVAAETKLPFAERGEAHFDEGAAAALGRRCGIGDGAHGLARGAGEEHVLSGESDAFAVEQEGAPLGRAAVLAACDDLLSGIAALLEIDAADELEVDHLRHEAVDRRRLD